MNWLRADIVEFPSTGGSILTDTAKATVSIDIIRKANVKLNERLILKDVVSIQEQEIKNLKLLNEINDSTISYYRNNLIKYEEINQSINNELKRQRDNNKLIKTICIGSIAVNVLLLFLIVK